MAMKLDDRDGNDFRGRGVSLTWKQRWERDGKRKGVRCD